MNAKSLKKKLDKSAKRGGELDASDYWDRIDAMSDEDIDTSDIPPLDEEFFANAQIRMPKTKETVTIRLDSDVVNWFKGQGKGYQTRINAILRTCMDAQKNLTSREDPRQGSGLASQSLYSACKVDQHADDNHTSYGYISPCSRRYNSFSYSGDFSPLTGSYRSPVRAGRIFLRRKSRLSGHRALTMKVHHHICSRPGCRQVHSPKLHSKASAR